MFIRVSPRYLSNTETRDHTGKSSFLAKRDQKSCEASFGLNAIKTNSFTKNDMSIKTWQKVDNNEKQVLMHLISKKLNNFLPLDTNPRAFTTNGAAAIFPIHPSWNPLFSPQGNKGCAFMIAQCSSMRVSHPYYLSLQPTFLQRMLERDQISSCLHICLNIRNSCKQKLFYTYLMRL